MNYEYIRLEQQIKQLMNRFYVPSSSKSQAAEELVKGLIKLYIDSVGKKIEFVYTINDVEPLYIEPENRAIMNVQYLNDVDISKLIGGVAEGYGIVIDNMGKGIYKINVKEGMFALKSDMNAINDRFDDYTTTADLQATYATKAKVEEIDAKFVNYATVLDLEENYLNKSYIDTINETLSNYPTNKYVDDTFATKSEVDTRFNDYTTTTDLEANYMKKDDVIPPSEKQFELVTGYNYYSVKHSDITNYSPDNTYTDYNVIKLDIKDETLMNQIKAATTKIDIFKVNLRKQLLLDFYGNILNDFIVSYNPETSKFVAPRVSYYDVNDSHKVDYIDRDDIEIWFDKELSFHPYTEYLNGELVIEYLLAQNALASKEPVLRCDIIDARNALKLRETDIYYFYRPSMILFDSDVKYIEDTEWSCECYKMIFKIPETYTIPINLDFSFKEYCFGNSWSLKWDGNKWCGDNIQGRINPKIIRKCNMRTKKGAYGETGCFCMVKRDTWNNQHIPSNSNGLAYSLLANSTAKTIIQFKGGATEEGSAYNLSINYSANLNGAEYKGYDLVAVGALYSNYSDTKLNIDDIEVLYLDLTLPNQSTANRLSFLVENVHHDSVYNRGHLDLIGSLDTVEAISGVWSKRSTDVDNTRDIVLYLNKTYTQAIDEINWDPTTNAFSYIIKQQFYEVSPNPNAATTLYTDYNITSSKIITADNITTMRSDLNMVTNTVDVVSFDVKEIRNKVDTLDTEMAETKKVTQHLQEDLDNVRMVSNVALAFGVIGTVGSIGSIGMQLASNGISFATKAGMSMIQNCAAEGMEHEMAVETITIMQAIANLSLRSIQTDITPVLDWCNEEYQSLPEITYEHETDNPKTKACSVFTTLDICNRFRDTLKQPIKLLVKRINEISDEVGMLNYISKDELIRDDTIDIFPRVENSTLILELEDTIIHGLIVFKIFVKSAGNSVSQLQRRLYIKVVDGEITAYKGVQDENITIDGVTIKLLARSEDDRVAYMPTATLILDNTERLISIPISSEYSVTGAVIETNTCIRQMVYTPKDFAYMQDIEALNKKIDTLAEQSHNNDAQTLSLDEQEYATIDEVNTALSNYVQIKDLPPTVDVSEYRKMNDLLSYTDTKCTKEANFEKSGDLYRLELGYVEDAHFVIIYEANTYSFNFTIDEQGKDGSYDMYDYNIADGMKFRWVPRRDTLSLLYLLDSNNIILKYELLSCTYPGPDEFALKSQIEELKAENANLKAQIAALKPKYSWQEFELYADFTERLEFSGYQPIAKFIHCMYNHTAQSVVVRIAKNLQTTDYLMILENDAQLCFYFRYELATSTVHFNECSSQTVSATGSLAFTIQLPYALSFTVEDSTLVRPFKYIFAKPA